LFQKQVAEQIGVDEDTICRWENNESRPQIQFIPTIIKLLGYDPFPLPELLPERLIFYRQTFGLSQRELGKRAGVDPKAIGLAERGKRPLSKKLLKLLESFKTSFTGCLVSCGSIRTITADLKGKVIAK
jgi:transcriptional regulator with XRE-family HTH domain